jgi:tetratricopeptide (TPR) repeat protein
MLFMLALGFLVMGSLASARAADEDGEYVQAIKLGSAEFEVGNYAEARSQFTRAHRQFPNARTLRALGMVEFELKNYGECIEYLQSALTAQVRALEPSQRKEAELLLARARSYVARLSFDVQPDVATVLMDGVPVKLDEGRTLVVQVGDHVLEFRAPGRLAEKRLVKVSGGEERTLHVVLPTPDAAPAASGPATEPASAPAKAPPTERQPLYKKPWLWIVVGVVVAGAAAGAAIALTRNKDPGKSADDQPDTPTLVAP